MATEDRASQEPPAQPDGANVPSSSDHTGTAAQQSSSSSQPQPPQPTTSSSDASNNKNSQNEEPQEGQSQDQDQQEQDPDVTASSPLPNRHTATTPGPRAQRFQEMFDLALNHTLTKISLDNFASCYPTIAAQAPHILKQVQRGMVDRLAQLCNQEFAAVLSRYQVVAKLNELESLMSDAEQRRRRSNPLKPVPTTTSKKAAGKRKEAAQEDANDAGDESGQTSTKPTPPHLLPAQAVLAAHLAPHLVGQQSQMNARLQNTQAANATLWEAVQAQRREVEELLGALEATLSDVDGAAALMDGVPAEELATESRTVEAEMADA